MVDVQTISVVIAAASVVIGVLNSIYSSRVAERQRQTELETRQAQLFMQLYDHYTSPEYKTQANKIFFEWDWSNYDEFIEKYGPEKNPETWANFGSVSSFYSGIGVLVNRGLIDPTLVDDLMIGSILRLWEKLEPYVIERRKRLNWPQLNEWFEYLYKQVKPISEQQHPEMQIRERY